MLQTKIIVVSRLPDGKDAEGAGKEVVTSPVEETPIPPEVADKGVVPPIRVDNPTPAVGTAVEEGTPLPANKGEAQTTPVEAETPKTKLSLDEYEEYLAKADNRVAVKKPTPAKKAALPTKVSPATLKNTPIPNKASSKGENNPISAKIVEAMDNKIASANKAKTSKGLANSLVRISDDFKDMQSYFSSVHEIASFGKKYELDIKDAVKKAGKLLKQIKDSNTQIEFVGEVFIESKGQKESVKFAVDKIDKVIIAYQEFSDSLIPIYNKALKHPKDEIAAKVLKFIRGTRDSISPTPTSASRKPVTETPLSQSVTETLKPGENPKLFTKPKGVKSTPLSKAVPKKRKPKNPQK